MSLVIAHLKGLVENQVWNGNGGFIKVCSKSRFWSLADWDVVEVWNGNNGFIKVCSKSRFWSLADWDAVEYGMVTTDLLRSVRNYGFGRWLTGMLLSTKP